MKGKLLIIGFGPGSEDHITKRAREALEESEVILGYNTYVDLIRDLITDQEIVQTGMTEEVSRAQEAVRLAEAGKKVAVISSGDAGVYGMAGLVYEVLVEKGWSKANGVEVEVVPGISAINSCAALLGAPVMHDSCTISLSDHLTPWELIEKRIEAAGQADFVIALYNPRSGRRTRQIVEAQRILLQYRSPDTPVGIVKSAFRDRQHVVLTTLASMLEHDIGMLTTVVIGNSSTFVHDGTIITPRGYQRKYTLTSDDQALKPHQRLRPEAEPWALPQKTSLDWAREALQKVQPGATTSSSSPTRFQPESILEMAVSPGVVSKRFTPEQMVTLAEVAGEKGSIEYTPHHQIILRVPTADPQEVTEKLGQVGFLLSPIGDVVQVKACDFCDGEKTESIPYVEEIQNRLGGLHMPKELRIGFNGCGMACYGAVQDDIGIVYRRGQFDLFLGAKTVGRTAHSGIPVAEGMEPEQLVGLIEKIVRLYQEKGHPNERFHKFFKRIGVIEGFVYQEMPQIKEIAPLACGD